MQYRAVPCFYGLAPRVVVLTGLSRRRVPTESMLDRVLSERAQNVAEKNLSLKIEPLHKAPFYMKSCPHLKLRRDGTQKQ
jgi:hypothetical protein